METPDHTKESGRTPEYSQKPKVRPNSKEKCYNERRGKSGSKLPRMVRTPPRSYKTATSVTKFNDKYDDSGDSVSSTLTGTSRVTSATPSIKEETPERIRPSHIPRRKLTRNASNVSCESTKKHPKNKQNISGSKNVQRVQMLLNPEFCPEDRRESVPASIATTRPIPTLGQIYGRINMIDSDRLNDWFLELNAPMNFIATSTPNNTELESDNNTGQTSSITVPMVVPVNCNQEEMKRSTIVLDQKKTNSHTNKSENYEEVAKSWMTSELDYPTRDTESGYQTISVKNHSKRSQSEVTSVKIHNTYCLGLMTEPTNKGSAVKQESNGTNSTLREQHTVVLCGTPDSITGRTEEGTNVSKHDSPMKHERGSPHSKPTGISKSYNPYPSNVQHSTAHVARIPVPSYTECLSEILQKTTNFEIMEGIEPQKSPSSAAVTDNEMHDNLSTGPTDEYCVTDNQATDWCRQNQPLSHGNMTFDVNSDTATGNWSCRCEDELTCVSSSEQYHWTWKHEMAKKYFEENKLNDHRKKAQRFKRFPSNRYKLPRTFVSWRRRLSLRRICRRRWNHVWKKTAERWATWSRSPSRFRKCNKYFRVMHYLQRSIIWEDADVQTNVLVYNETGTDSGLSEQKSAAISAIVNLGSLHSVLCQRSDSTSTRNSRSRFKHVNLGPSMFPFWYKRRSLNLQTSEYQGQTSTQYSAFVPEKQSHRTQMDSFVWTTHFDLGLSACNSVKSCQYDAALPKPIGVSKSTSLEQLNDIPQDDEGTETCDLACYSNKKVTTDPFSRYYPYHRSPHTSKDVFTPNLITCQNAGTDVTFNPNLESSTTATFTSGSDITYYRPIVGTDIEHLISESRIQPLHSILKNYNAQCPDREQSLGAQMSSNVSSMISQGVSTSNPKVNDQTTTISPTTTVRSLKIDNPVEKQSLAVQAEETKVLLEETETQMTPNTSKSLVSIGITAVTPTPAMSEKASRFISACLLLDSYPTVPAGLSTHKPNLAVTAPKIMSISSKALADKNLSSSDLVPDQEVAECKPEPASTSCLAVAECSCKSTIVDPNTVTALKNADTMVSAHHNLYQTRQTSTRGLDSYYETEILLNNLIKKALVGDMSLHSPKFSHQSNTNNNIFTVNTCCGPDHSIALRMDASIQHSKDGTDKPNPEYCNTAQACSSQLMSMCMLNVNNSNSTQTEKLKIEIVPPTPVVPSYNCPGSPPPWRPQLKCAEMMTSYCGFTRAIQVPASLATLCHNSWTSDDKCACASIHYRDTPTNTEYNFLSNFEQPTQTSYIQVNHRNLDYISTPKISLSAKADLQGSVHSQLLSLSRLIGKKKPSSVLSPPMTKLFSSDFSNDKWLKKTESADKAYNSVTRLDSCNCCIQDLTSICTCSNHVVDHGRCPSIDVPPVIMSKDSLADVLPSVTFSKPSRVLMVDQVTSDENVAKDVKESILQACPEICEAGTESRLQVYPQKSASVLTTQCVLPRPPPCVAVVADSNHAECVFVYGEPRCAIHKISADAGVQSESSSTGTDSKRRREKRNIPQCVLTSYTEAKNKNANTISGEHIPPKVYKALYENSVKLAASGIQSPVDKNIHTFIDAEVEAAKFHVPNVRSAGVVTSGSRGVGNQRCHCKDRGTHVSNKSSVTYHITKTVDTKAISVKQPTKAKLLQMPEPDKDEKTVCVTRYCDDCVRTNLLTSCRYFNGLVTKHVGRIRENCDFLSSITENHQPLLQASLKRFTKHAAEDILEELGFSKTEVLALQKTEAISIEPTGTSELGSQTKQKCISNVPSQLSGNVLSPATSVTDIGKEDKDHLKSVYYMLTAIEGRLRRLKLISPNNKDLI